MLEKVRKIYDRFIELEKLLAQTEVISDRQRYQSLAKEHAGLSRLAKKYKTYKMIEEEIGKVKSLFKTEKDAQLLELAKEEEEILRQKISGLLKEIEDEFLEDDDGYLDRSIIVEIRAGTGGEEAALFAADLYRIYQKYAQKQGWKTEVIESKPTGTGGMKEIIFSVEGKDAYKKLRFESGIHRVQRIPLTEAQGRIHTSAATVAVLPEAKEVEVQINQQDLKIDTYRSSGAGGQHVNVTDSAVRITHLPSGLIVSCQDERSQMKNKIKALRILRARLLDKLKSDEREKMAATRRLQVGSGDRSGKIRTYNFPDRRVTDHRIGFTLHKLEEVLEGNIEPIIEALQSAEKEDVLKDK